MLQISIFTIILLVIVGMCIGWIYTIRNNTNYQIEQNERVIYLLEELLRMKDTEGLHRDEVRRIE